MTRTEQAQRVYIELLHDIETMQDDVVVVYVASKYRRP